MPHIPTPYYDKFKKIFTDVNKNHPTKGDPAVQYAEVFERYVNRLLEEARAKTK